MSLTTTVTENGTLSTKGRFYEKPRNRPEGEGAARYPEGNPRPNTTLYQTDPTNINSTHQNIITADEDNVLQEEPRSGSNFDKIPRKVILCSSADPCLGMSMQTLGYLAVTIHCPRYWTDN